MGRAVVRRLPERHGRAPRRRWHVLTLATLAGHLTVFLGAPRLVARARRLGERGYRRSRPSPPGRSSGCWLDPDHARRARRRRGRPHGGARAVRGRQRRGRRCRPALPVPDDRANAHARVARDRHVAPLQGPAGRTFGLAPRSSALSCSLVLPDTWNVVAAAVCFVPRHVRDLRLEPHGAAPPQGRRPPDARREDGRGAGRMPPGRAGVRRRRALACPLRAGVGRATRCGSRRCTGLALEVKAAR